ncbi:hypothetical protein [Photobacterium carnosum]|nr:hypothetical protein [Photobacterium carnosum]
MNQFLYSLLSLHDTVAVVNCHRLFINEGHGLHCTPLTVLT